MLSSDWADVPLVRYLRMYRRRWFQVVLCVVMALLASTLQMPIPRIYGHFVDVTIPQHNIPEIFQLGILAFALYLAFFAIGVGQRYYTLKTTKAVIFELRARVCTKLQELCLSYYDNSNLGKLHARAMMDTEQVDISSNAIVTQVLVSATSFLIALGIILYLNWALTLVLLSMMPLTYLAVRVLRKRVRDSHREFRDMRETLSSGIHDLLNSIRLVKAFGMEELENAKMKRTIHEYLSSGIRTATLSSFFANMIMTFGGISTIVVWVVGAIFVIHGRMTLGEVIAFTGFQGFLLGPINQLATITETIYSGNTALKAVYELLDEDAVEFPTDGDPVEAIQGDVRFDNVSFNYSDGTRALTDISLTARAGQQVALVGASGAGKSTLIHLILGLYLPSEGQLLIDGRDLTTLNLRSLRRQTGIVSQETVLIHGTIRDNIRFGTPQASDADIEQAAIRANAHGFITQLSDGYHAHIGEDGVKLSGGQRQRLAIARALLRDPRILILDEATSALDSESELQVQDALKGLRRNRTTFVIAHRLSTILNSDVIVVLKHGKIVEMGAHDALLSQQGEYARLYHTQFHRAAH